MRYVAYSYRYGEEVLNARLNTKREVSEAIRNISVPIAKGVQGDINAQVKDYLVKRGWETDVEVIPEQRITMDFLKDRVGMEVQFGNAARVYHDLLKLQTMSYSHRDLTDVGVIVTATLKVAKIMGSNLAYFERVKRELPYYRSAIEVPLWVIGLEM